MLARSCFSQSQPKPNHGSDQGLNHRLLQDSAVFCIESAQKMVTIIHEHLQSNKTIGFLPWWHRVFYLHIAGTILIAAMLREGLFTADASQSWNEVIKTLRAHAHLSPFVQHCVDSFQTLALRISETYHRSTVEGQAPSDGASLAYFQDVFQDMAFDPDHVLFSKEDMSWLTSNFEINQSFNIGKGSFQF